jgi:hypothetical protein
MLDHVPSQNRESCVPDRESCVPGDVANQLVDRVPGQRCECARAGSQVDVPSWVVGVDRWIFSV